MAKPGRVFTGRDAIRNFLHTKWEKELDYKLKKELWAFTDIVWGKNDQIFPAEGAYPYKRDLKNLEFHLLDTGHFALEEDGRLIAKYMREFLGRNVLKQNGNQVRSR